MKNLTPEEFKHGFEQNENTVILDVRSEMEYGEGKIDNHTLLDFNAGEFESEFRNLDKSKTYYVYCRAGSRSAMACMLMEQEGYVTYNLAGGIQAWVEKYGM